MEYPLSIGEKAKLGRLSEQAAHARAAERAAMLAED